MNIKNMLCIYFCQAPAQSQISKSERIACADLCRCRQNKGPSINGVFVTLGPILEFDFYKGDYAAFLVLFIYISTNFWNKNQQMFLRAPPPKTSSKNVRQPWG